MRITYSVEVFFIDEIENIIIPE